MRNSIVAAVFFTLLSACGGGGEAPVENAPQDAVQSPVTLPDPVQLNPSARTIAETWSEFGSLEARMDVLLAADGPEQLGLELEEVLARIVEIETAAIPAKFEQPSVRSRLKVLKTYLLKTQAALHYRTDYGPVLAEAAAAYNALRDQLNHIVNSNLDPKLFEDD